MDAVRLCLQKVIKEPHNPEHHFDLATLYFREEQYAQAFTHFLRCTDCSSDSKLVSECLLSCSKIMCKQGDRSSKEYMSISHALSIGSKYPEPYYVKSMYHSWRKEWMECYLVTSLALDHLDNFEPSFINKEFFEYGGYTDLLFQKALAAYHRGKFTEARKLYLKLNSLGVDVAYDHIHNTYIPPVRTNYNYSQILQDVFVETVTDGMENGTYLEIGSNHYKNNNNTYLLEKKYKWKGLSIELDQSYIPEFNTFRMNPCICHDALTIEYDKLLPSYEQFTSNVIDYLQLDIDPAENTYEVLLKIPFDTYKFKIITYEHDFYQDQTQSYRQLSRKYLLSKGYKLIVGDITPDAQELVPFEDWWVHPDLVPNYKKFIWHRTSPVYGERYMKSIRDFS